MAGETVRSEAICLDIRPWSRTSHVVSWLTSNGKVLTVVKGAVRPKSQFLGQYDLNYTCEIVYYARAKGELHALRECTPLDLREDLRTDYRALALAGYFRLLVSELAPNGPDCAKWHGLLSCALSSLNLAHLIPDPLSLLLSFELEVLSLSGVAPDFSGYDRTAEWSAFSVETGTFGVEDGRCIRISREVADYLAHGAKAAKNPRIPLDATRVIGVFYQFHLDCVLEGRRTILGMVTKNKEGSG